MQPVGRDAAAWFGALRPRGLQLIVKHRHRFAGETLVLRKVEVAARGDAFEFFAHQLALFVALAEGKFAKDIDGRAGVMRQFFRLLPIFDERVARETDALVKADAFLDPVFVPRFPAPGRGVGCREASGRCCGNATPRRRASPRA